MKRTFIFNLTMCLICFSAMSQDLNVNGNIFLPSGTGNKQIFTWMSTDLNWRIGMSATPGFTRSQATSHVQYLTYSDGPGQGFAIGINGGNSSFEITGSGHQAFFRGNVGIGIANPGVSLDVNGVVQSKAILKTRAVEDGGGYFADDGGGNTIFSLSRRPDNETRLQNYGYHTFYSGGSFGTEKMRIDGSGNVGIGTSSPDAKLAVKGRVHAQEVKVDVSGATAPDYVFDPAYVLPTLDQVQSYIQQNKHPPEVQSAKEMEAKGVDLGAMNMLLLKKIEELTLYILEQEKRIKVIEQKSEK